MARTKNFSIPKPISPKTFTKLRGVIDQMEAKQISLARQPFGMDDLLHLFVEERHRETLVRAYDLCEPSGRTEELYFNGPVDPQRYRPGMQDTSLSMVFSWHRSSNSHGFYVPVNAGARRSSPAAIQPGAPAELVGAFRQVMSDMEDIHWRFTTAAWVLNRLNSNTVCSTMAQIRYVWPCIYTLLNKAGLPDEAMAVAEPSSRAGELARVPLDLQPWLKTSNDTIMRAMLLDDVPASNSVPVIYKMVHPFTSF